MENWFAGNPVMAGVATGWLSGMATLGVVLFVLLAALAVLFLIGSESGPARALRALVPSLRARAMTSLVMVATLPLISLALVLAERSAEQQFARVAAGLRAGATDLAAATDHILDKHLSGMVSLAAHIESKGSVDRSSLEAWIMAHHATNRGFITMLAADRDGRVIAATTLADGIPQVFTHGVGGISDREYFRQPLLTGRPFVSDAFRGRGLGNDAIVAISAPIFSREGDIWGIVEGSLNLSGFAELEHLVGGLERSGIVVADEQDRVIYASTVTGLKPLAMVDPIVVGAARRAGPGQAFTFARGNGVEVENFMGARQRIGNGWQALLLTPTRTLEQALYAELYVTAAWLAAAILVAVWVALAMANGVTRPLSRLEAMLDVVEIDIDTELPAPGPNTPSEIALVHERFASAIKRMRTSYDRMMWSLNETERLRGELADTLADQESEIRSRTKDLRRANMALELLNRTDSLTGLANRPGFEEFLHQAWGLAIRERQSIALICVDIDHFKAYNDEYGHPAGDRCLRAVAAALNGTARRPLDHVARTGGEEFVAVLGDTAVDAAVKVAEAMRRAVEQLRVPHRGSPSGPWVTVSVGVAVARPERGSDPVRLFEAADRALYAAKNQGRNRVVHVAGGEAALNGPAAADGSLRAPDSQRRTIHRHGGGSVTLLRPCEPGAEGTDGSPSQPYTRQRPS